MTLDSKIPSGPLAQKWDKRKFDLKLVNPGQTTEIRRDRGLAPAWLAPPRLLRSQSWVTK